MEQEKVTKPLTLRARIMETVEGREVRCGHGHLLGVFNKANQLVIKCREQYVIVEIPKA